VKYRTFVPSLFFLLAVAALWPACTAPLPVENRLAEILRLPILQPDDWKTLFSMADAGVPEAQYWLGRIDEAGILLPLDKEKSSYWYRKSAEQGYAPAEYWVCGKRANNEPLESEQCMWRAAENGVPEAQFWLGVAFDQHLWFGVSDEQEAIKWFRKAAEQGNPDAEDTLGVHYEVGEGVEQDYAKAAYWFRRAAEHVPNLGGAGQGRNDLGILYADGDGVPKDSVQAYMWFSLANADRNIDWIQHKLTPEQISKAQQLAASWKLEHPDPAIY
jgi:TPR repeat protein